MARLATYVYLTTDDGDVVAFGPDDEVPGWAQAKITNRDAWADQPAQQQAEAPAQGQPERPPEQGRGSSRDTWAAYAQTLGVEVDDGDDRDDLIAKVDAAEGLEGGG